MSGLVVSPPDLKVIGSAIAKRADQPAMRKEDRQAAWRKIQAHFAYPLFRDQTVAVLSGLKEAGVRSMAGE